MGGGEGGEGGRDRGSQKIGGRRGREGGIG